jgi:hypothetical protein
MVEVRMSNLKRAGVAWLLFTLLLNHHPNVAIARNTQPTVPPLIGSPPPRGLVAVIKDVPQDASLDLSALSNPYISGVALQIHWSDLEPAEGKPDWSKLDALFAAAEKSKKWVQLFIFPGFFSPAWALKGVHTDQFALPYGPGAGAVQTLPMPWDTVYLNRWFAFMKLLSDRYGMSPAFRVVAAAGPTSVSDEATLPKNSPEDRTKWESDGYTPDKYVQAWRKTFQVLYANFPNQYVSLSVGRDADILDLPGQRSLELGGSRTRTAIFNEGHGPRFVLQMNDVHAGPDASGHTSQDEDQYLIDKIGQVITGFQMGGGMEGAVGSAKQGAAGNPPLALRRSIDLAMEPNNAGQHVDFVEIYEPDVVPADMQPVLRYGASLFKSSP